MIGLGQWYFQLNLKYLHVIAWFVRDIWHKYHSWYFQIVSNFTRLTACEIMYNNFEISLVVFMPNITSNRAITNTNNCSGQFLSAYLLFWKIINLNLTFAVYRKRDS